MVQNNKSNITKAVRINGLSLTQIKIIVELWWDQKQYGMNKMIHAIDIHK